jgi:hypothetical protein
MANTLSASLILDTLSKRTQTIIGNVLAPLAAFSSDFSEDEMNQGQSVQIPLATAGGTAQTNPTNWESGDTTIGNVPVVVAGKSVSWHITPLQMNNSFRMEQMVDINLQNFTHAVWDAALAPFTGTHWSNFIEAQATFSSTNLKTIWGGIARSPQKNIILDATYYANFLPTAITDIGAKSGLAGFDGFFLNSRWTGAGTNVVGFAGGPQCVAYVTGIPRYDDETRADINATVVGVPLGNSGKTLSVLASTWLSRATRTRWASLDVMFGAAKLDNTKGYLIKSGGGA